ncbi:MAG: GNAT family N-acetyltransferase [Spirochaetales bacterium]|nr:GNAT family N-acetyltransferase [Spirochaetales bacterium]
MPYYDVLKPQRCNGEEFDFLLALGWYPMNQTIFTTSHLFSSEGVPRERVHWLRYPVDELEQRGSHRRILRKNSRFDTMLADPFVHTPDLNRLYEKYFASIDFDGYESIERATFREGQPNIYDTRAFHVKEGDRTVACGIFHEGKNAVASILHFFDPRYGKYSLGKYLILKTLDYCRARGIEWYYPGYILEGNRKMDYKLFLGQDRAQYYLPEPDPLTGRWLPLSEEMKI